MLQGRKASLLYLRELHGGTSGLQGLSGWNTKKMCHPNLHWMHLPVSWCCCRALLLQVLQCLVLLQCLSRHEVCNSISKSFSCPSFRRFTSSLLTLLTEVMFWGVTLYHNKLGQLQVKPALWSSNNISTTSQCHLPVFGGGISWFLGRWRSEVGKLKCVRQASFLALFKDRSHFLPMCFFYYLNRKTGNEMSDNVEFFFLPSSAKRP